MTIHRKVAVIAPQKQAQVSSLVVMSNVSVTTSLYLDPGSQPNTLRPSNWADRSYSLVTIFFRSGPVT